MTPPDNIAVQVLGAMITPAVLISAAGSLLLSTSNRLSRAVDRVRVLAAEAERLGARQGDASWSDAARRQLVSDQLTRISARVTLLRQALTVLYSAIVILVSTSIAVGLVALQGWVHGEIAVGLGLTGASALLLASLLLVREANLAVGSTLQETAHARELVRRVNTDNSPPPIPSTATPTAAPDPIAIVQRFNAALNAGDLDAMMTLLTPDCVFENTAPPPDGTRFEGQPAVRAFWQAFFRQSTNARITADDLFAYDNRCTMLWTYHWTDLHGQPGHIRGVDIYTLDGERIRSKQSYVKG